MSLSAVLLPEFDQEMANTRRCLERCPDDFGWRPHAKSPTLGWLASHLANLPAWGVMAVRQNEFDLAPVGAPAPRAPEARTRDDLLNTFDRNVAAARDAIESASDVMLAEPWTLRAGERTIFTMPRSGVLRSTVINHIIHHRAQLTVYLRLKDVPVPGMYGPSADEM